MTRVVRLRVKRARADLDKAFAFGVEGAGGFVEQQDRRVLEDGAREGEALALAAGEAHATVADHGVVAARLGRDEVVGGGGFGGGDDVGFAGAEAAEGDVGADGVVEEGDFLADDGDGAAQAFDRDVAQVLAVDGNASVGRVEQARDEVHHGRFAGAGAADESDGLAAGDDDRDVADGFAAVGAFIGEADMIEGDGAVFDIERWRIGGADDLRFFVDQFVEALGAGDAFADVGAEVAEGAQGLGGQQEGGDEAHEAAGRGDVGRDPPRGERDDAGDGEAGEGLEQRAQTRACADGLHAQLVDLLEILIEAVAGVALQAEHLDQACAGELFGEARSHLAEFALSLLGDRASGGG